MKRGQSKSAAKITALENEIRDLRQMIEGNKKSSAPAKSRSTSTRKKAKKKVTKKVAKKTKKKTTKKSTTNKTIVIDI